MKDGVEEAGEFGPLGYLGSHKDPLVSDRHPLLEDRVACSMNR
jgi:hypothetical protein